MADTPEERNHWQQVIKSYDGYMQYHLSANHARRMAFLALPKEQREVYDAVGYREKLEAVDEGIRRNAEFIDEMIKDPVFADMLDSSNSSESAEVHENGHTHSHSHSNSQGHTHGGGKLDRDSSQEKVRSTLRSFVRDWSDLGHSEREACYTPCLEALEAYFPGTAQGNGGRRGKRVLIPGCGLGRLAMEIAARGFTAQANEYSAYMLIASNFVLNQTTEANSYHIHPFLHSFSNHLSTENLLRRISIPDICPSEVLSPGSGEFSLVAGDFGDIYGSTEEKGRWSGVVTCFFIDCARNVLRYLRIIYDLLEDDGIWINVGPLLWHFENSTTLSKRGEGSVELSLDEVKDLARMVGFELSEEKMIRSSYTGIPDSMLRHEYQAAFWVARKRKPTATDLLKPERGHDAH